MAIRVLASRVSNDTNVPIKSTTINRMGLSNSRICWPQLGQYCPLNGVWQFLQVISLIIPDLLLGWQKELERSIGLKSPLIRLTTRELFFSFWTWVIIKQVSVALVHKHEIKKCNAYYGGVYPTTFCVRVKWCSVCGNLK